MNYTRILQPSRVFCRCIARTWMSNNHWDIDRKRREQISANKVGNRQSWAVYRVTRSKQRWREGAGWWQDAAAAHSPTSHGVPPATRSTLLFWRTTIKLTRSQLLRCLLYVRSILLQPDFIIRWPWPPQNGVLMDIRWRWSDLSRAK